MRKLPSEKVGTKDVRVRQILELVARRGVRRVGGRVRRVGGRRFGTKEEKKKGIKKEREKGQMEVWRWIYAP